MLVGMISQIFVAVLASIFLTADLIVSEIIIYLIKSTQTTDRQTDRQAEDRRQTDGNRGPIFRILVVVKRGENMKIAIRPTPAFALRILYFYDIML